jgi:CheY-like chemotaxis protein
MKFGVSQALTNSGEALAWLLLNGYRVLPECGEDCLCPYLSGRHSVASSVGRSQDVFEEGSVEAEQKKRLPLVATLPNGNGGLHILIVEDDPDTADYMALLLRYFGHRVQVALDGSSACQAARSQPPDVVLLDLALPGMDGWEVARRLQEQPAAKKPFLIGLTGYSGEEKRRRSRQAGIHLHLVKPVAADCLRRVLERFHRVLMPTEVSSAHETTRKADGREASRLSRPQSDP